MIPGWFILSSLLATGAMSLAAGDTALPSGRRWLPVFVLGFWVEYASSLVEAVAFGVMPLRTVPGTLIAGALFTLPLAVVAAQASSAGRTDGLTGRGTVSWTLRIAGAGLVFVFTYLTAGALVYPFVREFYAGRALPPLGLLVALQALRGGVLAVVALPLIAHSRSHVVGRAWRWAVIFALLAGVAPMITPNPAFPDQVRLAHMIELVGAHLVTGAAFAVLLGPRHSPVPGSPSTTPHAAPL